MLEGLRAINLVNLSPKKIVLLRLEGVHPPFIEEGDVFTGERERVRMLRNLIAHADEEWIMVGGYNTIDVTVECQVHVGGCGGFFRKGGHRYLQNTVGM